MTLYTIVVMTRSLSMPLTQGYISVVKVQLYVCIENFLVELNVLLLYLISQLCC